MTHIELETTEVNRYLKMLEVSGYGHGISDQEKRVRAGIAIAHEVHRNEYDKLKVLNESLLAFLNDLTTTYEVYDKKYIDIAEVYRKAKKLIIESI